MSEIEGLGLRDQARAVPGARPSGISLRAAGRLASCRRLRFYYPVGTSSHTLPGMQRIAYLIPEFPGQTHIWMWREIAHLLKWGVPLRILSTRAPDASMRARHAFAAQAESLTSYLWPRPAIEVFMAVLWGLFTRPIAFFDCILTVMRLPLDFDSAFHKRLALIIPSCILARDMRRLQLDRLHIHSCGKSVIIGMLCRRLIGTPFSITLNAELSWWGGAMEEKFAESDFTIAITQALLDACYKEYPRQKDKFLLGRIGVDTRKWTPAEPPDEDVWRIATVGRIYPMKAQDILLRALHILASEGRRVRCWIIGAGPQLEELQALSRELGLDNAVEFLGSMSEEQIIERLRQVDLFSAVSRTETLGVVYMEAMALGLPTIGTTNGGVHEIITHGVDGMLIDPDEPQLLADTIRELMLDGKRRRAMGQAARQRIIEAFDSRIGAATLYERVYGEAPPN